METIDTPILTKVTVTLNSGTVQEFTLSGDADIDIATEIGFVTFSDDKSVHAFSTSHVVSVVAVEQ